VSSSAYGTGLLVATRRGVLEPEMSARHQGSSAPVRVRVVQRRDVRVFVGSARPNPTFGHRAAGTLEGMISIDERQVPVTHRHALAVREVLRAVSSLAAEVAGAPLVSLQSPVQLPQRRPGSAPSERSESWGFPASVAVRFAMALPRPHAELRLRLADELTAFCRVHGYGLWLTDTRLGHRSGNWFPVLEHTSERPDGREGPSRRDGDGAPGRREAVRACLPVTLVGPARVGTASAVLRYLTRCEGVGVLGCSVTTLDDLAFVHLLLTGRRGRDEAAGRLREPDRRSDVGTDLLLALPACVEAVTGRPAGVPGTPGDGAVREALARLRRVAGDYQALVGPALAVEAAPATPRRPVWVSWQVEGGNPGVAGPLDALMNAFEAAGVGEGRTATGATDGPNVEYLVCREVGSSVVRAKGKLSLPEEFVTVAGTPLEAAPTKLCVQLEDVWRAAMRPTADRPGRADVAVAWREYWLAHARSS